MPLPPIAIAMIAQAVAESAKATGEYFGSKKAEKGSKLKTKEEKRGTHANLVREALNRDTENESHRLSGRRKLGQRRSHNLHDTGEIVRGALTS